MAFRVGQKVVCVDASLRSKPRPHRHAITGQIFMPDGDLGGLKRGLVYTIRAHGVCWMSGHPGVYLYEIIREIDCDGEESAFTADRFRHIVETSTETGMAILREILDRETIKDDVKV